MDFTDKYKIAKEHKDTHKSCGGEPYKSYDKLFEVVRNFVIERENNIALSNVEVSNGESGETSTPLAATQEPTSNELRILEIGTAVGFTTHILQSALTHGFAGGWIETIEHHQEHIDEAKKNITDWEGDISKIIFHTGEAEQILPTLGQKSFDIIFFDGYGVKKHFYENFRRILKPGGLLIVANIFLKSTEKEFFDYLEDKKIWEFQEEFADTRVYRKSL